MTSGRRFRLPVLYFERNHRLNYLSVCSGIEAASVAWGPLGWTAAAFSEIEKFPCAVLAHHYPDVPNLGDMTLMDVEPLGRIDILVGGTPCQAFSVAGLRQSLGDARGNLTLSYVRLVHELVEHHGLRNAVWENVPGVLSTKDNAFGCFLGALVGSDDPVLAPGGRRWPDAGMVSGPKGRAAWRILDAQYFGLAQRRRRVFVVSDFGNGADPAAVLFEPEGVPGNPAPRREQREDVTHPVAPSLTSSGRGIERTGDTRGQDPVVAVQVPSTGDLSHCLNAGGMGRIDYETETMIATSVALRGREGGGTAELGGDIATALRASTGGGDEPHVLTHAIQAGALRTNPLSGPDGVGVQADIAYTLEARAEVQAVSVTGDISHTLKAEGFDASEDGTGRGNPIIAFSSKDYGADAGELSPTRRAGGHDGSHANAGIPPAIAWNARQDDFAPGEISTPLDTDPGTVGVFHQSAVRRLTPVECERLQGFPEIRKAVMIRVCVEEKPDNAKYARQSSPAPSRGANEPALVHVQINLERSAVAVHKAGKLIWSVSNAGESNSYHLHTQVESFVRLAALTTTTAGLTQRSGKGVSPARTNSSSGRWNGNEPVNVYGPEIVGFAADAGKLIAEINRCTKSITSRSGRSSETFEPTLEILCSCAVAAIASFIPNGTLPANSYDVLIETVVGYTKISDKTADGPRYKALGNSMAVPVMRWIGERIDRLMPVAAVAPKPRFNFGRLT